MLFWYIETECSDIIKHLYFFHIKGIKHILNAYESYWLKSTA